MESLGQDGNAGERTRRSDQRGRRKGTNCAGSCCERMRRFLLDEQTIARISGSAAESRSVRQRSGFSMWLCRSGRTAAIVCQFSREFTRMNTNQKKAIAVREINTFLRGKRSALCPTPTKARNDALRVPAVGRRMEVAQ